MNMLRNLIRSKVGVVVCVAAVVLMSLALPIYLIYKPATSAWGTGKRGMALTQPSNEAKSTFKRVILPSLKEEFLKDISDGYVLIKRTLVFSELIRYEVIGGKHTYYVHVEFAVKMSDKEQTMYQHTLRGQEILFWVEGDIIRDYFPFHEYVLEKGKVTYEG